MRRRFFVMDGSVLTYTSITQSKLAINPSAFNIPVKSHTYDEIGLIKFNGVLSEIASEIFRDSYSVSTCVLPTTITKIVDGAFSYCYNLTSVYCKPTIPPTLGGTSVFDNNGSGRKIYVPYQSLDAYKTATNWSDYADDIVGYDFENDVVYEGIIFPITLIFGDNGEIGQSLYNLCKNFFLQTGDGTYYLNPDEQVYLIDGTQTTLISALWAADYVVGDSMRLLDTFGDRVGWLNDAGGVTLYL